MKKTALMTLLLSFTLLQAIARESIREGEQSGIPDRADSVKKVRDPLEKKATKERKREVRENQEETDPVFYDSTTSPKEMEQKRNEEY